ncbi:MAG: DUF4832 domain-containing protein [Lachnospiraceae bacterium]|nr:DUF4832 domain-containing protein [Lachnospiraceae bacterium]
MIRLLMALWVSMGVLGVYLGNALTELSPPSLEAVNEVCYEETTKEVENPERGFYVPVYVHYEEDGNEVIYPQDPLVHLRIDLSALSAREELPENVLWAFEQTLTEFEKENASLILRFAYDPWFAGRNTMEPSTDVIESHIRCLSDCISRHVSAVVCVECGMLGKWGEMHGSDACTTENLNSVIGAWLKYLKPSVRVSVRTPKQYCDYMQISLQDIKHESVGENGTQELLDCHRIGIYDDGYLASDTDLGTYVNREKEITWLSKQARHAFFGGELCTSYGGNEVVPTAAYMSKEAFRTHLTYLNKEWNDQAVNALKEEIFAGDDPVYRGESGYTYVRNHMGYRFVLRGVRMTTEVPRNRRMRVEFDVENVGFGNLIKEKSVELIITNENEEMVILAWDPTKNLMQGVNANANLWDSEKLTEVKIYPFSLDQLEYGEYQVYVRIADPLRGRKEEEVLGRYPIRFANEGENVWNEELEANYLGSFIVTEEKEELAWDYEEGFYWD